MFSGRNVFILEGCLDAPYVCMPHTFVHPRGVHTPICPHSLHLCSQALHVVEGLYGAPFVLGHFPYTTLYGGASPSFAPPQSVVAFLCIGMFWDISMLCGHFPFC